MIAAFVVAKIRVRHASQKRVIVVGTAARAAEVAGEIGAGSSDYQVIGVVDDSDGRRRRAGAPWLGPIARLDQIISWARPAWIVMAPSKGTRVPEAPLDTVGERLAAAVDDRTAAALVSLVFFDSARIAASGAVRGVLDDGSRGMSAPELIRRALAKVGGGNR